MPLAMAEVGKPPGTLADFTRVLGWCGRGHYYALEALTPISLELIAKGVSEAPMAHWLVFTVEFPGLWMGWAGPIWRPGFFFMANARAAVGRPGRWQAWIKPVSSSKPRQP